MPEIPPFLQPRRRPGDRLINRAGPERRDRIDLSEEWMLRRAERAAKAADWGDERFLGPLRCLLADAVADGGHTVIGRHIVRAMLLRALTNRLQVEAVRRSHPDAFATPVPQPLFIVGFARTGTTLLHKLLALDPRARAPRFWEVAFPAPPPDPARRLDRRTFAARLLVRGMQRSVPNLKLVHEIDPLGPEEDSGLLLNTLGAPTFSPMITIRRHADWLRAAGPDERDRVYAEYRAQLQVLGFLHRGEHWVLKSPIHQLSVDALGRAFPDAFLIQTHRDPLAAIPSLASLAVLTRGLVSDVVDLEAAGQGSVEAFVTMTEACLSGRAATGLPAYDVAYARLLDDPVAVVKELYRYVGLPYDDPFEQRMRAWLAEHRQHRHGPHPYSLETFGLDRDEVTERTSAYRSRFGELIGEG